MNCMEAYVDLWAVDEIEWVACGACIMKERATSGLWILKRREKKEREKKEREKRREGKQAGTSPHPDVEGVSLPPRTSKQSCSGGEASGS